MADPRYEPVRQVFERIRQDGVPKYYDGDWADDQTAAVLDALGEKKGEA